MSTGKRIQKDNLDKFLDYGIDADNCVLYIGSQSDGEGSEAGVDWQLAERVIKGLHYLDQKATNGITIKMNNIGGDWYHGMAIYDAIRACKNTVSIIVYGHAMSMGSIILQAADKRIMMPNSTLMIHYGSDGYAGHSKNFEKWAEQGKRINEKMLDIYLTKIKKVHPRYTREKLKAMCDYDTFLTAEETVELGLADEIFVFPAEP